MNIVETTIIILGHVNWNTDLTRLIMKTTIDLRETNDEKLDIEDKIIEIRSKPGYERSSEELKHKTKKQLQQICRDSKMKNWSKLRVKPLREEIQKTELSQLGIFYDRKYNNKRTTRAHSLFNHLKDRMVDRNHFHILNVYMVSSNCEMYLYAHPLYHSDLITWGEQIDPIMKDSCTNYRYQKFVTLVNKLRNMLGKIDRRCKRNKQ